MNPEIDPKALELLERVRRTLEKGGDDSLAETVKQVGYEAVEQMSHNLGGNNVSWSGGSFVVNVRTGNLRRHIRKEYPFGGNPYSFYAFNDAEYAEQIESGISGEQKKSALLFGGKAPSVSKKGRMYKRIPSSNPGSLIKFWTLHEDSKLNDQPARPFVQATAEQMEERAGELLGKAMIDVFSGAER